MKLNGPGVAGSWKVAFKYLTIAVFALESRHGHPHLLATPGKSVESCEWFGASVDETLVDGVLVRLATDMFTVS